MSTLRLALLTNLILLSISFANGIVVEELVFQTEPEAAEAFIEHDAAIWTKALASQPGFLKKEVWHDRKKPELIKLVNQWETMGHWNRAPKELLTKPRNGNDMLWVGNASCGCSVLYEVWMCQCPFTQKVSESEVGSSSWISPKSYAGSRLSVGFWKNPRHSIGIIAASRLKQIGSSVRPWARPGSR